MLIQYLRYQQINTCISQKTNNKVSKNVCFQFPNQDNALVSVEQESMVVKEGLHQGGKGAEVVSVHTTETINFLSIFPVGSPYMFSKLYQLRQMCKTQLY